MERSLIAVTAGLATIALLVPDAHAQDAVWDGMYAGIHADYLWGEPVVGGSITPFLQGEDFDGFAGGVTGGYNHVFDQVLVGVEADFALSAADGNVSFFSEGINADLDWLSTIRGRVGFIHENLLFFVSGGLALGGLDAEIYGFGTGSDLNETAIGYTIGAGAEWAINDCISVKAEYLYVDLANENFPDPNFGFESVGLETSVVRIGMNWHF